MMGKTASAAYRHTSSVPTGKSHNVHDLNKEQKLSHMRKVGFMRCQVIFLGPVTLFPSFRDLDICICLRVKVFAHSNRPTSPKEILPPMYVDHFHNSTYPNYHHTYIIDSEFARLISEAR